MAPIQGHVALAYALLTILVPVGVVGGAGLEETGTAIAQHTTYVELVLVDEPQGEPLAAVAGLVACAPSGELSAVVLWFNEQVLSRVGKRAPDTSCLAEDRTHVWAFPEGAPDPRNASAMLPTGRVYDFTDPNGFTWHVVEHTYRSGLHEALPVAEAARRSLSDAERAAGGHAIGVFPVWTVALGAGALDPTLGEYYNFVVLVDLARIGADGQVPGPGGHTAHLHPTVDLRLVTGPAPHAVRS